MSVTSCYIIPSGETGMSAAVNVLSTTRYSSHVPSTQAWVPTGAEPSMALSTR